ncbi:MAG: hypothetical protein K2O49_00190 [Muribaculaceae bacterium]|nr:hypothetical protein [Muribaculaceae bacterium]
MPAARRFSWSTVVSGVAIALSILGAGAILVESEITLINIPLFVSILFIIGMGIGVILRHPLRKLLPTLPLWLDAVIFAIFFASVAGGTLLLCNSLTADNSRFEETTVIVERKIIKTRHRGGSSGRRSYNPGTPYKVYYLEVLFPDGRKREIHPDYKVYQKAESGDSAYMKTGRGALGLQICEPKSLRLKHNKGHRKRHRYGLRGFQTGNVKYIP